MMAWPGMERGGSVLSRSGAILLLAGAIGSLVVVAIALGGGAVGLAQRNTPPPAPGELLTLAVVILFGLGIGALAIGGRAPFDGRAVRIGFGLGGSGFILEVVGSVL